MEPFVLWVYRVLLLLYPRAFRERFGLEMVQDFQRELQSAAREKRLAAFWLYTLWDVVSSSAKVRLSGGFEMNWPLLGLVGTLAMLIDLGSSFASAKICQITVELPTSGVCSFFLNPSEQVEKFRSIYMHTYQFLLLVGISRMVRFGRLEGLAILVYLIYTAGALFNSYIPKHLPIGLHEMLKPYNRILITLSHYLSTNSGWMWLMIIGGISFALLSLNRFRKNGLETTIGIGLWTFAISYFYGAWQVVNLTGNNVVISKTAIVLGNILFGCQMAGLLIIAIAVWRISQLPKKNLQAI